MTPGKRASFYCPKLDGLRFIAFLLVFIHHAPGFWPLRIINERGWMGVELFFVLSSFLLTKLLVIEYAAEQTVHIRNFFIRRILRIWPLYFLFILMMLGMDLLTDSYQPENNYRFIGLFTFTDDFFTAFEGYNEAASYISHLWTISLEEQYYLFLPFIVPFLMRRSPRATWTVGVLVLLVFFSLRIAAVLLQAQHPFIWVLPIQADALVFGTMYGLGVFDKVFEKIGSGAELAISILTISLACLLPNIQARGYNQVIVFPILSIGFLLLVDGSIRSKSKVIEAILSGSISKYLGKITYGLYVYHAICIGLVVKLFQSFGASPIARQGLDPYLISVTALCAVILISAFSYEFFEKRFLRLKRRYTEIESRPI